MHELLQDDGGGRAGIEEGGRWKEDTPGEATKKPNKPDAMMATTFGRGERRIGDIIGIE